MKVIRSDMTLFLFLEDVGYGDKYTAFLNLAKLIIDAVPTPFSWSATDSCRELTNGGS